MLMSLLYSIVSFDSLLMVTYFTHTLPAYALHYICEAVFIRCMWTVSIE